MTRQPAASNGGNPSRQHPDRVRRAVRRAFLALAGVALLAAALAPPAVLADGEPKLQTGVTDAAGVLPTADEARITAALQALRDQQNVQLFVAFVDTTGSATVTDFVQSTAEVNSLGNNDALLLVAIGDRSDALWVGPSLDAITNDEIDSILGDSVEPRLADGDFAGAVLADIDAIRAALAADVPVTAAPATQAPATAVPGETGNATSSGTSALIPVLAIVLIAGGVFLVGRTLLMRRAA